MGEVRMLWTRRRLLRAAGQAAGLVVAGCGVVHARSARPTPAPQPITLVLGIPAITGTARGNSVPDLVARALAPFVAQHRGVQIRQATFPGQATQTMLSALAAGQGPDVLANSVMPPFVSNGFLLDLGPFIREEGLDLSVFAQGMLDYFASSAAASPTNPTGTYGLPLDMDQRAYVVNLSVLDDLGLDYPDAGWTYAQYGQLFGSATRPASGTTPKRYGGMLIWRGYDFSRNLPSPCELHAWGGDYVDPTDDRRCDLTSAGAIAYGEWAVGLYRDGVVLLEEALPVGQTNKMFADGLLVVHSVFTQEIDQTAQWQGMHWEFFPMPVGPAQQTALVSTNFYAVNASTRYPDLAWELVRWLTFEPYFGRFLMEAFLYPPARRDQWEEWKSIVVSVAPALASKNLDVFLQQAEANHLWAGRVFPYPDTEVLPILSQVSKDVLSGGVSVATAFRQAAASIDALGQVASVRG